MAATLTAGSATGFLQARVAQRSLTSPRQLLGVSPKALGAGVALKKVSRKASKRTAKAVSEVASDSAATTTEASTSGEAWLPLVPIETLPKGERRLVKAEGETILLLWYKNEIFAIENSSPAEGAYSEGLFNAKLTQDGSVVCPLTDSTYDLKTGGIKSWYPNNPFMRFLTPPLRELRVFPTKIENYQICVNVSGSGYGDAAELVFAKSKRAGETANDLAVDEVRMIVDESAGGFGFTPKNELVNGRAAMTGFFLLIIIELITGKGLLGSTGFLDFLYSVSGSGSPV